MTALPHAASVRRALGRRARLAVAALAAAVLGAAAGAMPPPVQIDTPAIVAVAGRYTLTVAGGPTCIVDVSHDAFGGNAPLNLYGEKTMEADCLKPLSPSGLTNWFWQLGPIGEIVLTDGAKDGVTAPFRSQYQQPTRFEGEIGEKKAVLERIAE
ncbi:hypothetical protein sos41_28710 [Alphaproteobacteria bacterium SO-S41]|nr:hypothetical protein sos41_28710 [Alphaproteobacteria bacterium SO-S41]